MRQMDREIVNARINISWRFVMKSNEPYNCHHTVLISLVSFPIFKKKCFSLSLRLFLSLCVSLPHTGRHTETNTETHTHTLYIQADFYFPVFLCSVYICSPNFYDFQNGIDLCISKYINILNILESVMSKLLILFIKQFITPRAT